MLGAAILSAWLQYAADGKPHARAVVAAAPCPTLVVDGVRVPMQVRAGPRDGFPDLVCDGVVAVAAQSVRVGDRTLPAPGHDPRTIVVLGDTGCRIATLSVQSCDDADAWPLPKTARAIAALHPDLVIHVGDYLYRESGCPPLAHCGGSPHGDDAPAWAADWLTPAAPIFAAAPLVLTRGNHEECRRNGIGWFRYLDPHAATVCSNATEPYAIDLGTLRLVDFDSAVAEDRAIDPAYAPIYRRQFADVRTLAGNAQGQERWLVTHRPPYFNDDERTAMDDALTPFDLVLSGHIHFFAAVNAESLPPLVVNGEGGTKLDPDYSALLPFASGSVHVEGNVFGSSHFGFAVYTRRAAGWAISLRDPDGTPRATCTLHARIVHCQLIGAPPK
jgi:predicted MPP superfamily phosphohydrolase